MSAAKIGVIGGSGLYDMDCLDVEQTLKVETPFGIPSDDLIVGTIEGRKVVFLPRHGAGHHLLPGEIPFRANIFALKKMGVEKIISVSAVGSMKEHIHPRDIVIPDQFIDRTHKREDTFYGEGIVAHISFSDPVCPDLSRAIADVTEDSGAVTHREGTYVCIEGPAFSTKAESRLYRSWGVDVIGMTNYQEARLAREAEICYATMACVTDYDCWHEEEGEVTVDMIMDNLNANTAMAKEVIKKTIPLLDHERDCVCARALETAVLTPKDNVPPATRQKLLPLIQW